MSDIGLTIDNWAESIKNEAKIHRLNDDNPIKIRNRLQKERENRERVREEINEREKLEKTSEIQEIVDYLNFKTGRSFRMESRSNIISVKHKLNNGYSVQDFKNVIDCKSKEWIGTTFEKYLRPDTLFGHKFDNYLQQCNADISVVEHKKQSFTINGYNELITALRQMNYSDYLITEHWLHFQSEALIFFRNSCHLCGSNENINIHHKTYANRGRETFNDVVCLCRDCHAKFHDK